MGWRSRLKHAYNAFLDRPQVRTVAPYSGTVNTELGQGSSLSPIRARFGFGGDTSIRASIYTRMAIDCSSVDIRHVKKDEQDRYVEDVKSGLHNCLNVEANIDQSGRAFLQDLYMTLFEGGYIAVLPVDMSAAPKNGGLFDVETCRVGIPVQWYPRHVTIDAYNDRTGRREHVTVEKRHVGIVENPLYPVMNEPNSTLQRLLRKLTLLDIIDEKVSSSKLDLLIQLPFPIRDEGRRQDAERRRQDIEFQLTDSAHGIAYIDATEKVTQLNRPIENNLLAQVERLFELLYSQLGLTKAVMDGTAEEAEMLNYFNRTIEPTIGAVAAELRRKFLTKTARTQGHDIMYFRDPFKLVPMKDLAELADKFTRNEIVSSNEFRGFIGMRPNTTDPKADMLINSNLTVDQSRVQDQVVAEQLGAGEGGDAEIVDGEVVDDDAITEEMNVIDSVNSTLDEVFAQIGVEG
jgi:hypothetical protein